MNHYCPQCEDEAQRNGGGAYYDCLETYGCSLCKDGYCAHFMKVVGPQGIPTICWVCGSEKNKKEYQKLRDELNYNTGHMSNTGRMIRDPVYKKIVDLGNVVIPLILDEFDRYVQTDEDDAFPGHWAMRVLSDLIGAERSKQFYDAALEDGVRSGRIGDWAKAWVVWGEKNGYLAKNRPKHEKTPPIQYKGWIVVGKKHGEKMVLCPKREPSNAFEEQMGTASWVSKVDAARNVDDGWWKKYAWILPTKQEAEIALDILNEKIANGECSEFNKPDKAWIEEIK